MSNASKAVIAIVVVVVLALGALAFTKKDNTSKNSNSSNGGSAASSSNTNSVTAAMTITYDGTGFKESSNSIRAGQGVKVINTSSNKTLQFDSDPHPVHTGNTELNVGTIEPGQSQTFIVDKAGTWGYHNHLDASQHGSIIVTN